ncbi:hypothetical protein [Nocardia sp. NPDC004722]
MTQMLVRSTHSTVASAGNRAGTAGDRPENSSDCEVEPRALTYRQARAILRAHDQHFACRQYLAAVAYLSADNDVD